MVVSPTRELALQTFYVTRIFASPCEASDPVRKTSVLSLIGGSNKGKVCCVFFFFFFFFFLL